MNAAMMKYFFQEKRLSTVKGQCGKVVAFDPLIYTKITGDKEVVAVYWYDEGKKNQCDFSLHITPREICRRLAADPKIFRAMFLGQLKDFPRNNEFFSSIANNFHGDAERWILFAVAPAGMGTEQENGFVIPASFMSEVAISTKDGKMICPDNYVKLDEWDSAVRSLNSGRFISVAYNVETSMMNLSQGIPDLMEIEPLSSDEIDGC